MCLGWLHLEQMAVADKALYGLYEKEGATDDAARDSVVDKLDEAAFYRGKVHAARFFIDTVLPEVEAGVAAIKSENSDVLDIPEKSF